MKQYQFNYMKNFKCIGNRCKHNCCIGWDISVDSRSLKKYHEYSKTDSRFSTKWEDNGSFMMDKSYRCPFLDGDNLCHIIKNYGDKNLCSTCKTHPRFKNFFSGVTETGVGLYCEEGCRIILSSKTKMKVVLTRDDGKSCSLSPLERKIIRMRKKVVGILQNRRLPIADRLDAVKELCDIDLKKKSFGEWLDLFSSLEKIPTNAYSFSLIQKTNDFAPLVSGFELEYEQLLCYLVYRHLSRAIDTLDLSVRLAFVILLFSMINHIFYNESERNLDTLVESCRFTLSEIELSDDNTFAILNEIENLVSFL